MKAISIRQPWADLIIHGPKRIENRPRPWRLRGWVLVHAGRQSDELAAISWIMGQKNQLCDPRHRQQLQEAADILLRGEHQYGGIIGAMEILGCEDDIWGKRLGGVFFTGPYGLIINRVMPLPFLPCKGQLGPFNVDIPEGYFTAP